MFRYLNIGFLALMLCFVTQLEAQKVLKKQADALFDRDNFQEAAKALDAYDQLKNDRDALYMRAVCAFHLNQAQQCIDLMQEAFKKGSDKKDIYLYVAKSYQALGNYAEAAVYFKNQLKILGDKRTEEVDAVVREIKRCEFSPKLVHLPQLAYVDNLGSAANSSYDELNPIQSPNFQNKYYFSSNREQSFGGPRGKDGETDQLSNHYYYDLYAVELSGGNYTPIVAFGPVQNTTQNEIIQDFNSDGSVMYYLRYAGKNCKAVTDTFKEGDTDVISVGTFNSPFDPALGDVDLKIFNDSTIVFASKRLGGYGGYDIFGSKAKNGNWEAPINLGPGVNSPYNEKSPYLTKGGNVLFFASDYIQGLGGYDIFASKFELTKNQWTARIQLGMPINSPRDDIDPQVSNDGNQLLFSSNRLESYGGYDVYVAYFKEQITDQFVYTEDLPMFISDTPSGTEVLPDVAASNTPGGVIKSFAIAPLYYNNDEDVLSANNQVMIKTIKNILETFPETSLKLIGHSTVEKQKETALFFTIKRLERIAASLTASGIDASRITLCSYGSSFPMVVNESRYNTRIELLIDDANPLSTEIVEDLPVLNQDVQHPNFSNYLMGRKNLIYKVKFTTGRQMVRSDALLEFPVISVTRNNQGEYEYYCGYEQDYQSALLLRQKLQSKGYAAAKVFAFEAHQQLTTADAERMQSIYPDLHKYLNSEK